MEARPLGSCPLSPVVLGYHVVSARPLPHVSHLYPFKSPELFESDLRALKRRYELVSRSELRAPGRSRRPKALVTFDDGYAECFTVARPILLKHGVPCLFFLSTDFLDNRALAYRNQASLCADRFLRLGARRRRAFLEVLARARREPPWDEDAFLAWVLSLHGPAAAALAPVCRLLELDPDGYARRRRPYLSRAQARRLLRDGFELGAHSRSHPRLDLLPRALAWREALESCSAVSGLRGGGPVPFAFPFSAGGLSRGFLEALAARKDLVDGLFDAFGPFEGGPPRRLPGLVTDRLMADSPWRSGGGRSNVLALIRSGYGPARWAAR